MAIEKLSCPFKKLILFLTIIEFYIDNLSLRIHEVLNLDFVEGIFKNCLFVRNWGKREWRTTSDVFFMMDCISKLFSFFQRLFLPFSSLILLVTFLFLWREK